MPKLVDDQLFGDVGKVEDPDIIEGALRSKQFATVVDLLGYGEIEGILDGGGTNGFHKNVFLEGTPVKNAQGEDNFSDVEIFERKGATGEPQQTFVNDIETTTIVGVEVLKDTPISRTITNTLVNKIRVTLQIPLLQKVKSGDVVGTMIDMSIKITENDGTVTTPVDSDQIRGRVFSPFAKDYEIVI